MFTKMDKILQTTLPLVLCMCVMMVSAKNIETSVRIKRTTPTTTTENNCHHVKSFFQHLNITLDPANKNKGSVCGGECCGDETENLLRKESQKDFASLLRHKTRTVQGMLSNTGATLNSQVMDLSRQSENKTRLLFSQVYKGMAVLSSHPIGALYSDIRNYIIISDQSSSSAPPSSINIRNSVHEFFRDLFPLVFHRILLNSNENKDFASEYKSCLKKTVETILPFGDVPQQISESLEKSLEATRLLLQAFTIGTEVLNATDRLLIDESGSKSNFECHNALLKMTYCPKCNGFMKHSKPCSGYCLNVLRGCLTKYVAELDSPWNAYVEGIESLINAMKKTNIESGLNVDLVFKSLDSKISDAIMRAMQSGQDILLKVKRNCGNADLSTTIQLIAEATTPLPATLKPRTNSRTSTASYETKIVRFLTEFVKTRGFYGNLADSLCHDDSFAEPKDQQCWNGERIAEYTKTVVDVGYDMQKYNPEVKPMTNTQNIDSRIANLVDKLQRVHHMAIASSGADSDYMQRDGVEGSGTGSGYGPDPDDPDDDYPTGSGSGNGGIKDPSPESKSNGNSNNGARTPSVSLPTGGSETINNNNIMLIFFAIMVLARLYY